MKVTDTTGYTAGFLYTTKKMVHEITANSGPLAINNEYQVHWEGLTFRLTAQDTSFIDITVPIVVFNYPQEVSSAYIGFSLKAVTAMRDKLKPLFDVKEKEAVTAFNAKIKAVASKYNLTVRHLRTPMSNIHRHPGGLDRFSGTDYDTNPNNPGIVFPFVDATNIPIYSSIILHKDSPELAHTEYRVANKVDNTITYTKGKCLTYCKGFIKDIPQAYKLISNENAVVPSNMFTDMPNTELLIDIVDVFDTVSYNPDTSCIIAENLSTKRESKEKYWNANNYANKPLGTKKKVTTHVGNLPTIINFVDNYTSKYADKVFTINKKKYLTNDLYDLVFDVSLYLDEDVSNVNTFQELFILMEKENLVDTLIDEYENEEESLLSYKDEKAYMYKPLYPDPVYGKAARR